MPASASTTCPHCQATLKLKSTSIAGKTVPCPKCGQSFVVAIAAKPKATPSAPQKPSDPDAEFSFADLDLRDSGTPVAAPAPVHKVKKPKREVEVPEEEDSQPSLAGKLFRAAICINAHFAIAAVVIDGLWDLFLMLTHWSEFRNQMVTFRFAKWALLRPFILICSALYVWWESVLPRDRGTRHLVWLTGSIYIVLFGLVAVVNALMSNSLLGRPSYVRDFGVVYLGFSLLAFVRWGYPPETTLQLAERLTSEGNYADALTVVNVALQQNPDDQEAYELYRSLRDLLRHG